jgi:arylformamidase
MKTTWSTLTPQEREAHFNPRIAVPSADTYLENAAKAAAAARKQLAGDSHFDVRYGSGAKQTVDILKGPSNGQAAPVVLFIHGGYWRALDKDDHTHLAPPFVDAGAVFLNINYDLCPDVTVSTIANEIRAGLIWAAQHADDYGGDPNRIFLYGHSAGAHLAGMMMTETFPPDALLPEQIRGMFAISGIYEPEIARMLAVNEEIGLDATEAARNNVLQRTPHHAWPTLVAAGGAEPAGWVEQSRAFEARLRDHDIPVEFVTAEDCNHFSFLEILSDSSHPLVVKMLQRLDV